MNDVDLEYVEEGGPGVLELPAAPAEDQMPPEGLGLEPPQLWEEGTVEKFLEGSGALLHMLAGVGEQDWLMTKTDLERIAPPLTRIANRYEPLQRLSPYGDPLLVAHGFTLYGWRSALERKRAQRDAEEVAESRGARYERVGEPESEEPLGPEEAEEAELAFPGSPRAQP